MSATPQDYAKISRREISENVTSRLLRLFPDQSSLIREASRWWLNHDSQAESPPTTTRRFVDVLESFELWLRTPADSERARPRQVRETGSEYNVRRGGGAMTEQFERFLNEYRPFGSELYGDRPHMENQLRELVGETKEWREVINLVRLATLSDVTTMITGEIGTGARRQSRGSSTGPGRGQRSRFCASRVRPCRRTISPRSCGTCSSARWLLPGM